MKLIPQLFLLCVLVITLEACVGAGSAGIPDSGSRNISNTPRSAGNLLLLTDIHFNPYSECITGSNPCNSLQNLIENPIESWPEILNKESINGFKEHTNNAFMTQGINNLVSIARQNNVNRIVLTGDLLRHGFVLSYKSWAPSKYNTQKDLTNFSYKTVTYMLWQLNNKLPNTKIYVALGNNDSDIENYRTPSADFLKQLANYLSNFINGADKKDFITSFSNGGYFSTNLSSGLTLIGLNTNVLSAIINNETLANEQFIWLRGELFKAAQSGRKVILIQHIAYGIDLFKTSMSGNTISLLNLPLQTKYLQLQQKYSKNIAAIYAGHSHVDFLSLINSVTPLVGNIAFSSVYGNNPGFKIINIGESGNLIDFTTYISDLSGGKIEWRPLYNFSGSYGNPADIVKILDQFPDSLTDPKVITYRKYFNGNNLQNPQPISVDNNWTKYYYCGIKNIQQDDYKSCINRLINKKYPE